MEVKVHNNDVEKALKLLKKRVSKSGLLRELKDRKHYEKPSAKRKKKQKRASKRSAKE